MKYLKIFEAFKSAKISKTLKYINSYSRNEFYNDLSNLLKSIDFPLSEIDDNYIKYLSKNKGLNEKKINNVNFWFSKEGKYITKTIAKETLAKGEYISYDELKKLPDLTDIFFTYSNMNAYGKIHNCKINRTLYFLSDSSYLDGSSCDCDIKSNYKYSWDMEDMTSANLVKEVNETVHYCFYFTYDNKIKVSNYMPENELKEVDFCLSIDIDSLKEKGLSLKSIKNKRNILNTERSRIEELSKSSIKKIIDKLNIKGHDNLEQNIKRMMGYKNVFILFNVITPNILSNSIINYYDYIKNINDNDISDRYGYLSSSLNYLEDITKLGIKTSFNYNRNLESIKKINTSNKKVLIILDKIDKISQLLYNKLLNKNLSKIEDLEYLLMIWESIYKLTNNRNLFPNIENVRCIIRSISNSVNNEYILEIVDYINLDHLEKEINRFSNLIYKL